LLDTCNIKNKLAIGDYICFKRQSILPYKIFQEVCITNPRCSY